MNRRSHERLRLILYTALPILCTLSAVANYSDAVSPFLRLLSSLAVAGCAGGVSVLATRNLRQSGHVGCGGVLLGLAVLACGWLVFVAFRRYLSA